MRTGCLSFEQLKSMLGRSEADGYQQVPMDSREYRVVEEGISGTAGQPLAPTPKWLGSSVQADRFWSMVPWFVAAAFGKTERRLPKVSSTSYMNGIRGIACFIVFNSHISGYYYPELHLPYGFDERTYNLTQLPIIRIIYGGGGMDCLFFVLSGFVLSYSPLRKIANPTATSSHELLTSLSSSCLRRGIRLFVPVIPLVVITTLVTWYYPAFHPGNWALGEPTFQQHVWRFYANTINLLNPFTWDKFVPQGFDQCWTLALEYRGSLLVYILCVATCRLTTLARKILLLIIAWTGMYYHHWEIYCFVMGMFLSELRYFPLQDDIPAMAKLTKNIGPSVKTSFFTALLLVSMVLAGWPHMGDYGIQPFGAIFAWTPEEWRYAILDTIFFWGSFGAVGMMTAMENLPAVQWVLNTRPIMYLGEISYAFYLFHWLVFLGPGTLITEWCLVNLGWTLSSAYNLDYILSLIMLITIADYYWRLVDVQCIKLSKNLVDFLGVFRTNAPIIVVHEPRPHVEESAIGSSSPSRAADLDEASTRRLAYSDNEAEK
ncbi:acyltransferase family-domain-containing protein [Xylariales sp. PMI_506]|nr:acyltransferase family-domain-containing protein [Xylariales sp. PMI_506]